MLIKPFVAVTERFALDVLNNITLIELKSSILLDILVNPTELEFNEEFVFVTLIDSVSGTVVENKVVIVVVNA